MIRFDEILSRRDVPLPTSQLLRHNDRGAIEWRRGKRHSATSPAFRAGKRKPYNNCRFAFHFIPDRQLEDGRDTALFVGATEVLDTWTHDGQRRPRMSSDEAMAKTPYRAELGVDAFDLAWMDKFEDLAERLVIEWNNPRGWFQWADRKPKEVVELRRGRQEPPFPGFLQLTTSTADLQVLPRSWRTALASVGGVYLLVASNGDQYVGSAYGEGGFIARWDEYAANGHGGNQMLMSREHDSYDVSILEVRGRGCQQPKSSVPSPCGRRNWVLARTD